MRISIARLFSVAFVAALAGTAYAQSIPVLNWTFSDLPNGVSTSTWTAYDPPVTNGIPDWTAVGGGGNWNNDYGQVVPSGFGSLYSTPAPGGTKTAGYTNSATLEQQVGTVQPGYYDLVLSVSIGHNTAWSQDGWAALEIGTDPLVYATCVPSGVGEWETCTASTVVSGDVGQAITIELGTNVAGGNTGVQGDYTNVTLHAPEGGSQIGYLLLAGLCCFGAVFASRKQLSSRA
jgi:hypothetical protein